MGVTRDDDVKAVAGERCWHKGGGVEVYRLPGPAVNGWVNLRVVVEGKRPISRRLAFSVLERRRANSSNWKGLQKKTPAVAKLVVSFLSENNWSDRA